jgi:hypothetical protein
MNTIQQHPITTPQKEDAKMSRGLVVLTNKGTCLGCVAIQIDIRGVVHITPL